MRTDTQSGVTTQHRTAETKGEKQDDVVHHPGNDLVGIDEANRNGLPFKIHLRVVNIVLRRPTDPWKQIEKPSRREYRGGWESDKDESENDGEGLQRD
jgi:hypothetical protein